MTYISDLMTKAKTEISNAKDFSSLDNVRVKYLGKHGYLTLKAATLRELLIEERLSLGLEINDAKQFVQNAFNIRKKILESQMLNARLTKEIIDISLPGRRRDQGCLHPITRTIDRMEDFFCNMGFAVITGPEIEDEYHNFDALNIPKYHPARNDHDTFWFDSTRLLRTQTSVVQVRAMKNQQPPIRIIAPGRVYRNDHDQTHSPMFHQMEGFLIDREISFANLKGTLLDFLKNFFQYDIQIRFRPSYFPFTEPSAEIDVMTKNGEWLEVLGCGMIHPNVMITMGVDPLIYSGFAFGIGIERLAMLCYSISDIRVFFENDLRFLKQFK
ncbi:phenylalanine--tRNA ligase subunit alpha [Candidatus Erwinia haradaeae]|uniref:Phenylalanine--tRNA ligase alpha subunit n=1 Tax=Candidatus Erwinia haradaeae TaxID=1922217 RepID=A0A451D3E4_9GAMM|nr:phenylalanine--tRNA ligase subunit alpha [Candidatus Erwinia haradaeae]VFP80170.1 Phenylalanine--tRNA ligase alpha subunit [Candidatus Erwinia haradaeae]